MFVVDSNRARTEQPKIIEELTAVIVKGGGQLVNCDKWDDRKLCYPLKRHKRGTYFLSHFNADGEAVSRIERAAQLSETVLRMLLTVDEDGEAFPVYADTGDDLHEDGFRGGGDGDDRRDSRRGDDRRRYHGDS
jgi:small subunit ribosomal protein S6